MAQQHTALTIGDEINIATRSLHTKLNRNITARLPLALPPTCSDTAPYATGFAYFAYVYLAFERAWENLDKMHNDHGRHGKDKDGGEDEEAGAKAAEDPWIDVRPYGEASVYRSSDESDSRENTTRLDDSLLKALCTLRPEGLPRTQRALGDLARLLGLPTNQVMRYVAIFVRHSVTLQAWKSRIQRSTYDKPHLLLAYAWTMYMAVFSGGRYIRSELMRAGDGFWQPTAAENLPFPLPEPETFHPERPDNDEQAPVVPLTSADYLTFWSFPGDQDGNDIKTEFKLRLQDIQPLLTEEQRKDIVAEAIYIFESCLVLVDELDAEFASVDGLPDSPANILPEVVESSPQTSLRAPMTASNPTLSTAALLKPHNLLDRVSYQFLATLFFGLGLSAWLATARSAYLSSFI